jgi:hypothetical protein
VLCELNPYPEKKAPFFKIDDDGFMVNTIQSKEFEEKFIKAVQNSDLVQLKSMIKLAPKTIIESSLTFEGISPDVRQLLQKYAAQIGGNHFGLWFKKYRKYKTKYLNLKRNIYGVNIVFGKYQKNVGKAERSSAMSELIKEAFGLRRLSDP